MYDMENKLKGSIINRYENSNTKKIVDEILRIVVISYWLMFITLLPFIVGFCPVFIFDISYIWILIITMPLAFSTMCVMWRKEMVNKYGKIIK